MKTELPKRRNLIVKDMVLRNGGGKHRDKRCKRQNNPKRQEWRDL
jgi:hypothetical protein